MKSVSAGLFCCGAVLLCLGVQGQASATGEGSARRAEAGVSRRRTAAQTWSWWPACQNREGFFDPKAPTGEPTAAGSRDRIVRPAATATPASSTRSLHCAELRQFRSGIRRQPRLHRQLQRVQHLRHRDTEEAAAARVGCVPRWPGRCVGATAICCSCRSSRRVAGSTAARRASATPSAPSGSAAFGFSTSAT